MSQELDPTVADLFAATQGTFSETVERANNWPKPNTESDCTVTDMSMKPGKFKWWGPNPNGGDRGGPEYTLPCISAYFSFNRIVGTDDPEYRPNVSYEFQGEYFSLLAITKDMPENTVRKINANNGRFITHLAFILNLPYEEVKTNVLKHAQDALKLIKSGQSAVNVRVRVKQNVSNGKTYNTEYLIGNLSAS